jgi:hypothetical protein
MSKNNITGADIQTKSYSKDGRENHDFIFRKQNATQWCKEIYNDESVIIDGDGFRWNDGVTMETPINRAEFDRRFQHCTVKLRLFPVEGDGFQILDGK